jgi:hypothetical protein
MNHFDSKIIPQTTEISVKSRKRHHQYPEFGHTQGEIEKKLEKSILTFKGGGVKLRKRSLLMVF